MPITYDRQYNFANFQYLNPTTPLPGSQVDAEYNAVKIALDSLASDLGLIQKDDGTLQNGIVRPQHLASDFITGIAAPTAWTTATNYTEADTVFYEAKLYSCEESHLSGVFATDLSAGKWVLVADFASAVDDAINITFDPQAGIAATNVQEAIEEAATDAAAALATLAAGDFLVKTAFAAGSAERVVTDTPTLKWDWATAGAAKADVIKTTLEVTTTTALTSAHRGYLVLVDTTAGLIELTMPSLSSGDAGWYVDVMKTNTTTTPMLVLPPSGMIRSGGQTVARTRRCIPHAVFRVFWTGTEWIAERCVNVAVGSVLDFTGSSLPVGYEWPNGQTLASASTNYRDFHIVNGGSSTTVDCRGRVVAGKDDMGGTSADRITVAGCGINGDSLGAVGGAETHTLTEAQLASHDHTQTAQTPNFTYRTASVAAGGNTAIDLIQTTGLGNTVITDPDSTPGDTATAGSGNAHNNVQPTIVLNKILVVE